MQKYHSKHKKELGRWGESTLDAWMCSKKWNAVHKNLSIRNGEIDRVYESFHEELCKLNICIAEVKTSLVFSKKEILSVFSEVGFKRYFKQRQLQNLYRFGETLQAQKKEKGVHNFQIFLRFFLILKIEREIHLEKEELLQNPSLKLCHNEAGYLIFSVEPEFTPWNARKSLLQIKI